MLELNSNATEEPLQDFRLFAKGSALRRNPGRHSQKTLPNPSCCGRSAAGPSLSKPERKPNADEKNGKVGRPQSTVSLFIVQEASGSRMRKGTQAKV